MLDRIEASDFSPSTGKICSLHLPDGKILPVLIDNVTEKPQCRNPYAQEGQRLPFSVSLTAQQATDFTEGECNIELEGKRLTGVGVSRVAPLGRDPMFAYYQIIFN
jgi:hypothetical protein